MSTNTITEGAPAGSLHSGSTHIDLLSRLMFQGYAEDFQRPKSDLTSLHEIGELVSSLDHPARKNFLALANTHHVLVRALKVLEHIARATANDSLSRWCQSHLTLESARVLRAVDRLAGIFHGLQDAGLHITVIKSLDHWPDLGSDLDLYTTADEPQVVSAMKDRFHAEVEPRSWGDRLAHKWNFKVPGLPESIEIHVGYLGQTGEQRAMARRVIERSLPRELGGHAFLVPAPEERVLISTLQRMYRHFYFRLCDMADFAGLLQRAEIDFTELRKAALCGGIWPGTATFLHLVAEYARRYGSEIDLPVEIVDAAYSPDIRVYFADGFLRVPKGPAAGLYGSQLVNAGRRGDLRAMLRLPLLPPLAVSALLAYHLTGSDKGVW